MSYVLGVDLGTSYTAAATFVADHEPVMVGLGNRALQVPSVAFVHEDEVVVGELAEHRAFEDPTRVIREFKRRLGDSVPIWVHRVPYSVDLLLTETLRWVLRQTTERMGGPPSRLALTHPATWGRYKIDALAAVASQATDIDTVLLPEPVAAAICYASRAPLAVGSRIVVYDLGGGTFDVCVLEHQGVGFAILGTPDGIEGHGGADFDYSLIRFVLDSANVDPASIDPGDPGLVELRRNCIEAKEALSADVETTVRVAVGGVRTMVRITRPEFEAMIEDSIAQTVAVTQRALRSARTAPADVTSLVLVGGSSRIPLVTELLTEAFQRPIARDTHPKHDIALGAALTAGTIGHLLDDEPPAVAGTAPAPDIEPPTPPAAAEPPAPIAPSRRAPRAALIGGGIGLVAAVTAAIVVLSQSGGTTPLAGGDVVATSAVSTSQQSQASPTPDPTSAELTSSDARPLSSVGSTTEATGTALPDGLPERIDVDSARWFAVSCAATSRIALLGPRVADTYASASQGQNSIAEIYRQIADTAESAAVGLASLHPGYVSGRMDNPNAVIDWFGVVGEAYREAATRIQELTVTSGTNLALAVGPIDEAARGALAGYPPFDPSAANDVTEGEALYLRKLCQ